MPYIFQTGKNLPRVKYCLPEPAVERISPYNHDISSCNDQIICRGFFVAQNFFLKKGRGDTHE